MLLWEKSFLVKQFPKLCVRVMNTTHTVFCTTPKMAWDTFINLPVPLVINCDFVTTKLLSSLVEHFYSYHHHTELLTAFKTFHFWFKCFKCSLFVWEFYMCDIITGYLIWYLKYPSLKSISGQIHETQMAVSATDIPKSLKLHKEYEKFSC